MKRTLKFFWMIPISFLLLTGCEEKEELSYIVGRSTVTDIDGNTYKTIMIAHPLFDMGEVEIMAENLKVTHFKDGTPIPENQSPEEWRNGLNDHSPQFAWSHYSEEGEGQTYGVFYNWYVVSDTRGLCPTGWHVPNNEDWERLFTILGGRGIAGGKLKSKSNLWLPPNTSATDEAEFSSLPGGFISSGPMEEEGLRGWYWTSTEGPDIGQLSTAYAVHTNYDNEIMGHSNQYKSDGRNIRCVKD